MTYTLLKLITSKSFTEKFNVSFPMLQFKFCIYMGKKLCKTQKQNHYDQQASSIYLNMPLLAECINNASIFYWSPACSTNRYSHFVMTTKAIQLSFSLPCFCVQLDTRNKIGHCFCVAYIMYL